MTDDRYDERPDRPAWAAVPTMPWSRVQPTERRDDERGRYRVEDEPSYPAERRAAPAGGATVRRADRAAPVRAAGHRRPPPRPPRRRRRGRASAAIVDPEQALAAPRISLDPDTLHEHAGQRLRAVPDPRLADQEDRRVDRQRQPGPAARPARGGRAVPRRAAAGACPTRRWRWCTPRRPASCGASRWPSARLANVLVRLGELAEADRLFTLANSPELPDRLRATIHHYAGKCAFEQDRYIEACQHFEKALELRRDGDPELVAATEVALDALFSRVAERGWGPYPRSRDEILLTHKPPVPTFEERYDRWGYQNADGSWPIGPAVRRRAAVPRRGGLGPPGRHRDLGADRRGRAAADRPARRATSAWAASPTSVAWVSRDGNGGWFAIDKTNRVVIQSGFDDVRPFRRGIAIVRQRGKWGAVEKNGRLAVQFAFDAFATGHADGRYVEGFTDEGLAIVEVGGRKGVIDRAGRVVVPLAYPTLVIHPVAFLFTDPNQRWGAIGRRRAAAGAADARQPDGGHQRAGAAAGRHPADAVPGRLTAEPDAARLGSWSFVISAGRGCSSARSRTATGSPTVRRSRRTPPPRASGPPSTSASPPSTPPTCTPAPGPRPCSAAPWRASAREGLEIFTKVYWPTGPRPQRPRPVPQAHHGVDQRLAAAAADRLRRPLPGPPLRLATPLEETMEAFADVVHSGKAHYIGVSEWTADADPGRPRAGPGAEDPARVQPAAVLDAVAGHRGRGRPDLRGARHRPDRLVADRAGRADRQVPAGPAAAGGLPGHRRQVGRQLHQPAAWATRC